MKSKKRSDTSSQVLQLQLLLLIMLSVTKTARTSVQLAASSFQDPFQYSLIEGTWVNETMQLQKYLEGNVSSPISLAPTVSLPHSPVVQVLG